MRRRVSRHPIEVRFSRALFPSSLLVFTAKSGSIGGLQVDTPFPDSTGKAMSGDGLDVAPLPHGGAMDLLVIGSGPRALSNVPKLANTLTVGISQGAPLVLRVSWKSVGHAETSGQLAIVWSHEDWIRGRSPFIAYGEDAEVIGQYVVEEGQRVTGNLLRIRSRVRSISRIDIRRRVAHETRGMKVDGIAGASQSVQSIEVEGLRGFRETGTLRLAQPDGVNSGSGLTVVVGANNAGKSTVWEAFDAIARKRKGDVSFSEGRRNKKSPQGIRIALKFTNGLAYVLQSQSANTSETVSAWAPTRPDVEPALEIISVPSRRYFQASFGKNTLPQRDWMSTGPDFSRNQQRDQFTGRLFALHSDPTSRAKFDDLVTSVLGAPLDWSIELSDGQFGSNYYLKIATSQEVTHSSEGLGDGIISLLFILNALYDAGPGTLLVIDEPELSLHPQLVKRLGAAIARQAAHSQIVILTHSPLLVSWDEISAGAEIARVFKVGPDSRIAQVSRSTIDEVSKARGGWKNPHVLGSDANEALFLDDEIIVVEGQEDAGLLPIVFSEAGVMPRGSIFGWGSGGGDGNPRRIVALLAELGFSKVVALLDHDKPEEVAAIAKEFPDYMALSIPADDIRDKPAETFQGKEGLLDKRGKKLKSEYVDGTREVLEDVVRYLGSR